MLISKKVCAFGLVYDTEDKHFHLKCDWGLLEFLVRTVRRSLRKALWPITRAVSYIGTFMLRPLGADLVIDPLPFNQPWSGLRVRILPEN